jgi:hypothetical protein
LKQALKILKDANQSTTIGYLYLLKRLANVCFLGRKFADAEKFFKVAVDLVPQVTKNPSNLFNAQKNLLLFYTFTNLDKALVYSERLEKDEAEMLPIHLKELKFMSANILFLSRDYMCAKLKYRELLAMDLKPTL